MKETSFSSTLGILSFFDRGTFSPVAAGATGFTLPAWFEETNGEFMVDFLILLVVGFEWLEVGLATGTGAGLLVTGLLVATFMSDNPWATLLMVLSEPEILDWSRLLDVLPFLS
jgi:hypothetical protein